MKNVKFKIMKIRTGCQYVGCFYYTENLNWTAQNLRLGRGLDVAGLVALYKIICLQFFICILLSVLLFNVFVCLPSVSSLLRYENQSSGNACCRSLDPLQQGWPTSCTPYTPIFSNPSSLLMRQRCIASYHRLSWNDVISHR